MLYNEEYLRKRISDLEDQMVMLVSFFAQFVNGTFPGFGGQMLECVTNPNLEGKIPDNQTNVAFCYATSTGVTWVWNTPNGPWS